MPMATPPVARSTFVTILGWLGAAFGAMGLAITALQLLMLATVMPDMATITDDPQMASMPPAIRWMFEHFALLVVANMMVMATMLAGSVGLLRRRNWGRLVIIGLLAVAIVSNFAGVAMQYAVLDPASSFVSGATAPPDLQAKMESIRFVFVGMALMFAIAFALFYGWLIRRLLSPAIRREFGLDA